MSELKHTDGPWNLVSDPCHFDSMTTIEAGNMVVQVGGLKSNVIEMEANARLIACAPELLDVLVMSRGNVASLGPAGALANVYQPYEEWIAAIDKVIEKAIGKP